MQAGLYHPPVFWRSGVQSLRMLESSEDVLVRKASVPAIVHVAPDPEDFFDPFTRQVPPCLEQLSQLDELREVPFLLRRKKMESAEERNHVVQNGLEVVHLVV